mmetsp:Transcript_10337/g.30241  ORF Transcript_10337/g.30241 Transcript_10337/m.30241 type:complete len:1951 (+) Transcript_10337:118-5970(+)
MGKYSGTLHKLIESACHSNSDKKWSQVLFYLEGHTISDANTAQPPGFESPLAPSMVPSPELERELFDQQGPKREDSPLKIAVKSAPAKVIAALCHIGPEASRMVDNRERLPIHVACRRSSEDPETEKVLMVLAKCNHESLLHRDDCGRTPLHWLFWFHAKSRSPEIVRFFCQELPYDLFLDIRQPQTASSEKYPLPEIHRPSEKMEIPQSASIVHDSCHGALPLHYAVMQGASKESIRALINDYPGSIAVADRRGRSPLAWYLGAGSLSESNKKNICGEINDPNIVPWWHTRLSMQLIQLLVSSKAARMVDRDKRRTSLHWACVFFARSTTTGSNHVDQSRVGPSISNKIFQIILNHNIEALTFQDVNGETPLHVMFSVIAEIQNMERQRITANRNIKATEVNLTMGGPPAFNPPKQLLELLLKCPDVDGQDIGHNYNDKGQRLVSAASLENKYGILPLHTALHVATSSECIELLIQSHPTGLVHSSEEQMQTPLIHAFSSEFSTPLQPVANLKLLLATYPTSRHGTYMDGRLAVKMEDALGMYPIHYACQNHASFETVKLFVENSNRCATHQNSDGELPIHCILSRDNLFVAPTSGSVRGASLAKPLGLMTEIEKEWRNEVKQVQKLKMKILLEPLKASDHLKLSSYAHGMTPLHVAVAFGVLSYERIFRMMYAYPEANRQKTTEENHEYFCIQLHDRLQEETEDLEEWQAIKELIYSFNPLVDSHRREEELLDACCKVVRNEITGNGSFHLKKLKDFNMKSVENIDLNQTFSEINVPVAEASRLSETRRQKKARSRSLQKITYEPNDDAGNDTSPSFVSMLAKKLTGRKKNEVQKSIYDDDLQGQYVVSPQQSMDEDEEHNADAFSNSSEDGRDSEYDSLSDEDLFSDTLVGDAVSQSLSQTLSYVQDGTCSRDKSLLRKAIAGRMSEDQQATIDYNADDNIREEKKENMSTSSRDIHRVSELSPVALRLWCFFVTYNDRKSPEDNYLHQVESILEDLEFDVVEKLIDLAVPDFAVEFMEPGVSPVGLTMRNIASPKVKALFESYYYFLGRYEFSSEIDGVLLHRSCDSNTVYIRAIEHVVRTTEYQPPKIYSPGVAEESIWNTGEMVRDEEGYEASKFKDKKRQVCFKFTRNETIYNNEVKSRAQLGMKEGVVTPNHILPLLCHFNSSERGRYRLDVKDERFMTLNCYGGDRICLSDYPYALVYPHSDEGDLYDYSFHQGSHQHNEIVDIGLQVTKALKLIHEKNVIHRNLSLRSIAMLPFDNELQDLRRTWALTNFSGASCNFEADFMGAISQDGSAQFQTGLLPPEMFTKVSCAEEKMYRIYWEKVEKIFEIKADRRIKEPYVDPSTGCSYVVRCHFVLSEEDKSMGAQLPELPYMLVQTKESVDLWCLGLLLYTLCSGGRPLFPVNIKSGLLLDYQGIVNWNMDCARSCIYENVENPVAQDLLLKLLAPFDERSNLTAESVLSHPYFSSNNSQLRQRIIENSINERATHLRNRTKDITLKYENNWLASRSVKINCWNFDMLKTFHFSSSEIVRKMIGQKNSMPSSFIILPYKLSSKNKKAKLSPTTKKDVERAERMGVSMISLAKALFFGSCVEETIKKTSSEQKWDAVTLLKSANLPAPEAYEDLKEEFCKVAADHIEAFRADPRVVVKQLIERRYLEIRAIFKDAGRAFVYLVDEFIGIPLVGSAHVPYPLEIAESSVDSSLSKILPFMHCCSLVARGTSGGITGIVRLIFEAAFPHVPPSWNQAASGLIHPLDEDFIKRETMLLHRILSSLHSPRARRSLGDDLSAIKSMCTKTDIRGEFANLHRVQCADSSLWTSPDGLKIIQDACDKYDFKQALKIQADLETKLTSQQQLIKQLQEKIEVMNWHKELNLNIPDSRSLKEKLTLPVGMQKKIVSTQENLPQKNSTRENGSNPKLTSDGVDVTSLATTNSKSTYRDHISVD